MSNSAAQYAADNQDRFERELVDFLSIPSVSTLSEHAQDCRQAAQWVADKLEAIGLENVEVIEGTGHPLVYADWLHADGRPTVLCYGHYDVQPVDPIDLWDSPPFEPAIRDGYVFARGAVDDKGQVAAMVNAAASFLATGGSPPVNLRFLIEGEEESGGEHIREFVLSGDHRLDADFVHVSDSSFFDVGISSVCTGLRGIVYAEVRARGADHDLHSGEYGGVGPNPLMSLAHVIARLRDSKGNITIPGFFDDVVPPSSAVLDRWRSLPATAETVAKQIDARKLIGDPSISPLERMWSRPTLDVHGIPGGFTAEGAKTVIPAVASAKISMRIVPSQKASKVFALFEAAVREAAPDDVNIDVKLLHADDPVVVPEDTPEVRAALVALTDVFGGSPVVDRSGGSIPIVGTFQTELGLPSVLLGYGLPGDNAHAPNERFLLDQFHKGIRTNIRFWELAGSNTA